jgi:hypothetical protein
VVCDSKVVVRTIVLWDQYSSVQLFELLALLKVLLTRECCFHCFKLCGATLVWAERVTSSDIVQTCV